MAVQPCMEWIPIKKKKADYSLGSTKKALVKSVVYVIMDINQNFY